MLLDTYDIWGMLPEHERQHPTLLILKFLASNGKDGADHKLQLASNRLRFKPMGDVTPHNVHLYIQPVVLSCGVSR